MGMALESLVILGGLVVVAALLLVLLLRRPAADPVLAQRLTDLQSALAGLASLFLQDDKPAIRKTLLRLRYLDKFAEEARARRINLERSSA